MWKMSGNLLSQLKPFCCAVFQEFVVFLASFFCPSFESENEKNRTFGCSGTSSVFSFSLVCAMKDVP